MLSARGSSLRWACEQQWANRVADDFMDEAEMAAWMRAAQEGDTAAYARLLTAITPIIRRMAAGRWTGSEEADDVVQDVLLCCTRSVRPTIPADHSCPG